MKTFAFASRHTPTPDQLALAAKAGVKLVPIGDLDGFTAEPPEGFDGVVVVHAAAAVRFLARGLAVGVFSNVNRAAAGQPPQFRTNSLTVYAVGNFTPDSGYAFPLCTTEIRL